MRNKLLFIGLLLLSINSIAQSEQIQIREGRILFEKKINIYANGKASADLKRLAGQFRTTQFSLDFNSNSTLYTPYPQNKLLVNAGRQQAENNIVYTDCKHNLYQSARIIFNELFIVEDTLERINWKITNEKRNIAGVECRRANAIIFDSIYVVAFYADAIPVSSGPELFSGLPGMILGISLPHLHINIFATKVLNQSGKMKNLSKPFYKQPVLTNRQLKSTLMRNYKEWGSDAESFLIQCLL